MPSVATNKMKISIITITYNSSKTLATTLESVAAQDYHNIEHIIVDGLSKDNTIEIVKQFPHVAKWVSEKDKGLYDALNKGIQMATGDVIGLIHSDDFLASNDAVSKIAKAFQENNVDSIIGDISFVNPDNLKKICFAIKKELKNYVVVLVANIDRKPHVVTMIDETIAVSKNLDATKINKEYILPLIKGGGGGQKTFATAGGSDISKLEQVIEKVKSLL